MQRAPEVPQILADLMRLSERELILKAYEDPIVARWIVCSPVLLGKIIEKKRPSFLFIAALENEQTARLIFRQINVAIYFPVNTDREKNVLIKVFCHHTSLSYRLEIIRHCREYYPSEICLQLYRILFTDDLHKSFSCKFEILCQMHSTHPGTMFVEEVRSLFVDNTDDNMDEIIRFFIFRYDIHYSQRLIFLQAMIDNLTQMVASRGVLDHRVTTIIMDLIILRVDFKKSRPWCQLPTPLIVKVLHDVDKEAAKELNTKISALTNSNDPFCRLLYVKLVAEGCYLEDQKNEDSCAEYDRCFKILDDLITINYEIEECQRLKEGIYASMLGFDAEGSTESLEEEALLTLVQTSQAAINDEDELTSTELVDSNDQVTEEDVDPSVHSGPTLC